MVTYTTEDIRNIAIVGHGGSGFYIRRKRAFLEAFRKAKPVILEPIVETEVAASNESMGDIAGDISGKRGHISDTNALNGGMTMVRGRIPLNELDNYQSQSTSMTGGIGSFSISFSHYVLVAARIQQELIQAHKPVAEEA